LSDVTPTVYVVPAPATTLLLIGVADRLKSGGAVTTSVAAAVWTVAPLVAVIVSGYVPGVIDVAVLTASCADPAPPVMTVGLMLQLAWLSDRPLSVSETSPVNPFTGETETLYETAPPAPVLAEDGDTLVVKSGVVPSH
jgi:hypothetical protein